MSEYNYDYFVIGAGSGGVRSARIAAGHGAKVGIAESTHWGGTCVNVGCVPKKLFAYAADFHAHFEDSKNYGWSYGDTKFDWQILRDNKNKEIERLNGIYTSMLEKAGVEMHWGHAKLTGDHTIDIDGKTVSADKILIATGGTPRKLDIPGGEHAATSDDAFYLEDLPEHITIIGGGYVAVEFAHIFSGLGHQVSLLYRRDMFLGGFDRDISKALAKEMEKQGIDLQFNTSPGEIRKEEHGYTLITNLGKEIQTGLVMAAIGRDPNTANLGLKAIDIETHPSGKIKINEEFQTTLPHIHAIGDIVNPYTLTPVAIAEGHFLADKLFGGDRFAERIFRYTEIATAIFSSPPIGTIGLSEAEALEMGYEIDIYQSDFRGLKHTISGRDERSLMKVIVDRTNDNVLGMHMMGADSPEIMQGFAVAINMGMTKADLDMTVGIHPTAAEEFVTMRTLHAQKP